MKWKEGAARKLILDSLRECCKSRDLERGRILHADAVQDGGLSDTCIANTLVHMYARCSSMVDAHRVFDRMPQPDAVSWTVLISGYAENGKPETALDLFSRASCVADALTYVAAIKACSELAIKKDGKSKLLNLQRGLAISSLVSRCCFSSDIRVTTTLVDMFSKCGGMIHAQKAFDTMPRANAVSWNCLIFGYAENGESGLALQLLTRMQREGCAPEVLSFVAGLRACSVLATNEDDKHFAETLVKVVALQKGMAIHALVLRNACCGSDIRLASTLLDMYVKCGSMSAAQRVFEGMRHRNVISWTALIMGYVESGQGEHALELFSRMTSPEGCVPDSVTFVAALKACAVLAAKEAGKLDDGEAVRVRCREKGLEIHAQAVRCGFGMDLRVLNTLVDMYAKCGSMVDAQQVFDEMRHSKTVVSWNALMFGYAENGKGEVALELLARMKHEGYTPNKLTFVAAVKACTALGALAIGRKLHTEIHARGFSDDLILVTSLMNFYAKCGSMPEAQQAFDSLSRKSLITWNALMAGYARHGDAVRVFDLFYRLKDERMQANGATFHSILNACSHAGLVDKGKEYFESMESKYGITPALEHYISMVDILGRANKLEEAVALVSSMPFAPNAVIWTVIVSACELWKNTEIGRIASNALLSLGGKDVGAYVTLHNFYRS